MWWKKKKKDNEVEEAMRFIKEKFENLHNTIKEENKILNKEQLNFVEKQIIIKVVEQFIVDHREEDDDLLKEFRSKILKTLDDLWAEKEPDRVVSLLD